MSTAPDSPSGWDKKEAAKYLDDRMDLWFRKADKLRTGQGVTSCVSCHTVIPYVMARPALRKALGENQPAPAESKVLQETVSRVETYATHEPLYERVAEQSRGSEAVLNLVILGAEDARQGRPEASGPTRQALEELWKRQRPDGAWNWHDFSTEPWESSNSVYYGAALAALAVGTVPGYADRADENASGHVARLRDYLTREYPRQNLYNRAWLLLASTRLKGLLDGPETGALRTQLLAQQGADGGWSLYKLGPWTWSQSSPAPQSPKGKLDVALLTQSDGYGTGLVAYALRQSGLSADHAALKKATDWLEANQRPCQIDSYNWKCWRTYSLNFDREHGGSHGAPFSRMLMSDAATAFAALALLPSD